MKPGRITCRASCLLSKIAPRHAHNLCACAPKFHTREASRIFCHAQVAAKNRLTFYFALRGETLRGFSAFCDFTLILQKSAFQIHKSLLRYKRQLTRAHALAGQAKPPSAALSSLTYASKPASSALPATSQPGRQVLWSFSRRINGSWPDRRGRWAGAHR